MFSARATLNADVHRTHYHGHRARTEQSHDDAGERLAGRYDQGRQGLPFLGGLPILGRLFTSPTRDNRQIDIVISVTPRVLRAPAVTPRDEEMRPSGTLQSPTTGSLAEMIREADREDQIAAARTLPET